MCTIQVPTKWVPHSSKGDARADNLHDESEFDEEELSDEDSDYGNARKKGEPSPAKKAKKSSAKQSSATGSRKKKSLSLLPAMPLDILFERHHRPFPNKPNFPGYLPVEERDLCLESCKGEIRSPCNMTEPQWAVLLFENVCQTCGAKNVLKPEFSLLRRICITCKQVNLVVESKFKTRFPGVNLEILELIPYTNVGTWSHGYDHGSRFFWVSDIETMLQKLSECQHNVLLGRPGAQQALDDFKTQQMEIVSSIREQEGEEWCDDNSQGRHHDSEVDIDQRFEFIRSKSIELGYIASDVAAVRWERESRQPALLSDPIWKFIRPVLEPIVLQNKRDRLEGEMKSIRAARRAIIHWS